jgi:hypothetical protein
MTAHGRDCHLAASADSRSPIQRGLKGLSSRRRIQHLTHTGRLGGIDSGHSQPDESAISGASAEDPKGGASSEQVPLSIIRFFGVRLMPRDNFSGPVIKALRERVAHRCSNPDCRVPTIGPGQKPLAVASIGKAAHITAAAPGGPRYDAAMTQEQRKSIDNALWLCSNCATNIDADAASYPTELLQQWKGQAEKSADEEKGRTQPRKEDATAEVLAALTGAMPKFTLTAISNAHRAVGQVLHALDPRFAVETSYRENTAHYTINARERVDFTMTVPAPLIQEWRSGMRDLLDHGREAILPADGVEMTGSSLLQKLFNQSGFSKAQIILSTPKRIAILKLRMTDPASRLSEPFDDMPGGIVVGKMSLGFDGSACGGLLAMSFCIQPAAPTCEHTFTIAFDLQSWDGVDARRLPYFDKLHRLAKHLGAGLPMSFELEMEGQPLLSGNVNLNSESDPLPNIGPLLDYLSTLRKISAHLNVAISFVHQRAITWQEVNDAMEVAHGLDGPREFRKEDMNSSPTAVLTADGDNIRDIVTSKHSDFSIILVQEGGTFMPMGQTIDLPQRETRIEGITPKLSNPEIELGAIKDGENVELELEPTEAFLCTSRFVLPADETLG